MQQVVTTPMRRLLLAVLVAVAVLIINSVYLATVSLIQWWTNEPLENAFYQSMFLFHLVLGLGVVLPALVFIGMHLRRAIQRPNRIAVRLGLQRSYPFSSCSSPELRSLEDCQCSSYESPRVGKSCIGCM